MSLLAAIESPAATNSLTGWDAIQAADGLGIAVTGTLIVFTALTAVSMFIGVLPKLLAACGPWLPVIESHHDAPPSPSAAAPADDKKRLAAAIAWAVHRNRGG